MFSSLHSA